MILSSKHTPCLNNFAEQNRNKHFVCFSSQKLPYGSASVFVYGVLRTPSQHNKNEEHSKEHSSFLVRFVQTYSVIKIIAKAIINNHSICFSSQKPPYSGASVFVYGVLRTPSKVRVPTTRNNKKSEADKYLLRYFWYAGRDSNPRPTGS